MEKKESNTNAIVMGIILVSAFIAVAYVVVKYIK